MNQYGYGSEMLYSNNMNWGASGSRLLYSSDNLLLGGSSELGLEGETWLVRQFISSDNDSLGSMSVDERALRIKAVGSHSHMMENGIRVNPSLSIGLREDDKCSESFLGIEMGGRVSFTST